MTELGCHHCKSHDHGETLDDYFYCFKCMLATRNGGNDFKIWRDDDGNWQREFTRNGRNGWIPIFIGENLVEELYGRYLAKLIVE